MAIAMVAGSIGCLCCFSTARYDDAHIQRVATINARYEAEHRREDARYASLVTALDQLRRYLLPIKPDSQTPPRRGDEAGDLIALRNQCRRDVCQPGYVDMLICLGAGADQLRRRAGECRAAAWLPDRVSSSPHGSQSPGAGQSATRK